MQNLVALVLLLVHLSCPSGKCVSPLWGWIYYIKIHIIQIWSIQVQEHDFHMEILYFVKKLNLTNCGIHILKKFIENCNANSCDNSDIHYTAQLKFQEVSAKMGEDILRNFLLWKRLSHKPHKTWRQAKPFCESYYFWMPFSQNCRISRFP